MASLVDQIFADPAKARAEFSLHAFVRQSWHVLHPSTPFVDGWAVGAICEHLQAVTDEEIDRLVINVPPGCTKSMCANVLWPSWEWGPYCMPETQYINASYDKRLAVRDMMHTRDLISSEWYQSRWPLAWKDDDRGKEKFANVSRGFRYATSVGGGLTGWRAQRFIIDDPHSVQLAESDVERAAAAFWFTETTPTRFTDPKKPVYVVIMQRLHVDDISGLVLSHLMDDQGWTHLCLPMEAEMKYRSYTSVPPSYNLSARPVNVRREQEEGDPLPHYVEDAGGEPLYLQDPRTEEGQLLWPERYDEEAVRVLKAQLMVRGGEYAVAGQLQQRPVPRGGGMFHVDRLRYADELPEEALGCPSVRGWDLAGTGERPGEKKSGRAAWTVGGRLTLDWDGVLWITDEVRGRWESDEVLDRIVETAERDGQQVIISVPQDPGQAGKAQVNFYARRLHGYDVRFSPESGSKDARAVPLSAQVNAGNVRMLRAAWNGPLVAEMGLFPGSTFKDQIDAFSRAYAELLRDHEDEITTSFGVRVIR